MGLLDTIKGLVGGEHLQSVLDATGLADHVDAVSGLVGDGAAAVGEVGAEAGSLVEGVGTEAGSLVEGVGAEAGSLVEGMGPDGLLADAVGLDGVGSP